LSQTVASESMERVPCPVCGSPAVEELYGRDRHLPVPPFQLSVRVAQCAHCGFIYNNPRPSEAYWTDYYRRNSLSSGNVFRLEGPNGTYTRLHAERAAFFAEDLAGRPPGRFLDVGSGQGDFLLAMKGALPGGWSLHGLEPSATAAADARARGFEVQAGYLGDRVEEGEGFDAVSLISVLEHLPDPLAALRELRRLVRPGGVLCLEVPDTLRPEFSLSGWFGLEHICHFWSGAMRGLLGRAGWPHVRLAPHVSNHGLRLVALDESRPGSLPTTEAIEDRDAARSAVRQHAEDEARLLVALEKRTLDRLRTWSKEGRRIALYGAGGHTVHLCGALPILPLVDCLIDGDPRKQGGQLLGLDVIAPTELEARGIDAVLISSQRFVSEISDGLRTRYGDRIQVAECYAD
jgi:SAM-dependent methyltransferase